MCPKGTGEVGKGGVKDRILNITSPGQTGCRAGEQIAGGRGAPHGVWACKMVQGAALS